MKKFRQKKGFTLVELLVAMSIFLMFIGVLINSYSSIVRGQREANEYRIMYVEARKVFEMIGQELRNGTVDYAFYKTHAFSMGSICFISKDAKSRTYIAYDSEQKRINLSKEQFGDLEPTVQGDCVPGDKGHALNTDKVKIASFKFLVSPNLDPFDQENVLKSDYDGRQPKVAISATFEKVLSSGKIYTITLQTTVSSRVYNQVYQIAKQ